MRPTKVFYMRVLILCILMAILLSACGQESPDQVKGVEDSETQLVEDKFVLVPGSKFIMGSTDGESLSREDEYPQHDVVLSSFFIMKREVTNFEYQACVDEGACTRPLVEEEGPSSNYGDSDFDNWPVVNVDWFQAAAYCEWADMRLPTEAEWEKATRGREAQTYPWGDDEPECALANMLGCFDNPGTVRVLSYPNAESPYKLTETAGNVSEWTADWYAADYYETSPGNNPPGPADGELKVARGGSWNDGAENLRAAARLPIDPYEQSDQVGFRCIPIGKAIAPICPTTFRKFCEDPRIPRKPGDEPCVPDEGVTSCGGYEIAGFGCPDDELVEVSFAVPAGIGGDYNVTIGGSGFDCEKGDGVIFCTGPEQKMGSTVGITICGAPPDPNQTESEEPVTAEMNLSGLLLNQYLDPLLHRLRTEAEMKQFGFCPDGYRMNEKGNCVQEESRKPCPEGWYPEPQSIESLGEELLVCFPEDTKSCPVETEFDDDLRGCVPVNPAGGCPGAFETTPDGVSCGPPVRRLESCQPGYWMDTELGCCVPFEGKCEDGEYIDTMLNECLEIEKDGCPRCTTMDAYEGCIPIPGCDPADSAYAGTGPQVETMNTLAENCFPDDSNLMGTCLPPKNKDDEDCSGDYVATTELVAGDPTCKPSYGPGSGCPRGYILDPRTECCVPLDNPCPDDPNFIETPIQFLREMSLQKNPFYNVQFGAQDPFSTVIFGDGDFNPYGGDCEGINGSDDGCPPGTFRNDDGGCEDETDGSTVSECPAGCLPDLEDSAKCYCEQEDNFICPEDDCWLTDTGLYTCTWTCDGGDDKDFNPCDTDDQVWIPEYELCVPRGDDCCAPGYDWSTSLEECMPIIQPKGPFITGDVENECSDGYEYTDDRCMLTTRRGGERCCWSVSVNVPRCIGPCEIGYSFDTSSGRCVKIQKSPGGGGCNCAEYASYSCSDCGSNSCCRKCRC